jgi:hypothetical protein
MHGVHQPGDGAIHSLQVHQAAPGAAAHTFLVPECARLRHGLKLVHASARRFCSAYHALPRPA